MTGNHEISREAIQYDVDVLRYELAAHEESMDGIMRAEDVTAIMQVRATLLVAQAILAGGKK